MNVTDAPRHASLRRPTAGEALAEAPVGIVPIIWNNADLPELTPEVPAAEVLDEIQRLGYRGTQLGTGFPSGARLAAELQARGLRLAEVYAGIPCGPDGPFPTARDAVLARLEELHAANGEVLVMALDRPPERDAWVGRADGAPGLTEGGWRALGALVDACASEARAAGHRAVFHNHAGTYVETTAEIERLLDVTDPHVGLCLDAGHALLGGADPVSLAARHAERVGHVHLKDVDPGVVSALRDGRLTGFANALRERVFAPLGSGLLDLPRILGTLAASGYRGWLMVEQDTSWEPPSEAAAIGRRVLDAALRWLVEREA